MIKKRAENMTNAFVYNFLISSCRGRQVRAMSTRWLRQSQLRRELQVGVWVKDGGGEKEETIKITFSNLPFCLFVCVCFVCFRSGRRCRGRNWRRRSRAAEKGEARYSGIVNLLVFLVCTNNLGRLLYR